ncbi:MAG TPA: RidA family protein [Vicinamibacterales bacterium]|nr:RidA family protein [Vicinamibacterales bacterium]
MPAAGKSLALPAPPRPLGQYVAAVATGDLLVVSGMLPLEHGLVVVGGRVGDTVDVDSGRRAAKLAALNALAVAVDTVGSLDKIRRVVRATVMMTTSAEFTAHAAVADGASEVFASLFAEGHTRVVLGVNTLPLGATVLLDVTFEVRR